MGGRDGRDALAAEASDLAAEAVLLVEGTGAAGADAAQPDAEVRIVFANAAARTQGFVEGATLAQCVPAGAVAAWRRTLALTAREGRFGGELPGPDGSSLQLEGRRRAGGGACFTFRALEPKPGPEEGLSPAYLDVLEAYGFGVWRLDRDPERLWWSERCYALTGLEPGPVTQESYLERVLPDDQAIIAEAMAAQYGRTGTYNPRFRIRHPDGQIRHLEDRGLILWDGDEPRYAVGVTIDRTPLVEAQERISALTEELAAAAGEGLAGRLALGVAHDLNNVLTVVLSHAQLLEDAALDPDALESLASIEDAARHAGELSSRLLAFGRRAPLERRPIELGALLTESTRLLSRLVSEATVLELEAPAAPVWVEGDRTRLAQVLTNLVINAAQAFVNGRGRIRLRAEVVGEEAVLRVHDDGPGMAPAVAERAFEPFFTTRGTGTGLGLASVRGIVLQHQGRVLVETAPGAGTTFAVHLPLRGAPERSEAERLPAAARPGRLWFVEDERLVRALGERILRAAGHQVTSFAHPAAVQEHLASGAEPPELLVTDVVLPDGSGPELAGLLQAQLPSLEVLFVSGYAEPLLEADGSLPESARFLPKPFTRTQLLDAVGAALPR
ncbi:MAG: ATP-binding protein [Myxococcota bacterium]